MNNAHSGLLLFFLLLLPAIGCQFRKRAEWNPAEVTSPRLEASVPSSSLAMAESAYARAIELEKDCNAACVDYFFQAAAAAWSDVELQACEQCVPQGRAAEVYHSALTKLISSGQQFGRFDPSCGLKIQTADGCISIPTSYHGFPWQPEDFDHLIPVGDYSTKDVNKAYRYCGQGVATVAIHCNRANEPFRQSPQPFCATALLRPVPGKSASASSFVLELFDPLRVSSTDVCGRQVALKRDITAQFVYSLSQVDRELLKSFTNPGSTTENSGLFMIEPYQPGKIPLVFIHGLLSDPYTWINMANELRAHPEILEHYQLWGFQYATGEPFLKSAAILRRQLQELQIQFDPTGSDAALSQMVLIGHSMGGLVSKLQIAHSGNQLWEAISCRPLESIVTTPETRMALAESVFFEPSPLVSRVVFIGTPHRGSPLAYRSIGSIGSNLVDEPSSMEQMHQQLLRDNPGMFSREFTKRIPTSIDLLKPDSPLLLAADKLPRDGRVKIHTIAGYGYRMLGAGDSDTRVPLSSAVTSGAETEKLIHAKHSDLNKIQESIDELLCILKKHYAETTMR